MSDSKKPIEAGSKPAAAAEPKPGDGIRGMRTMHFFKVLNFELYARPNLGVMIAGVAAFSLCTAYVAYMNITKDNRKTYMAMTEDGSLEKATKKSKWD